jgi:PAS domain S-box-containing protein
VPVVGPPASPKNAGLDPLEKRALLWSMVGLGMLLLISLLSAWTLRQVSASDFWVDHTQEVIRYNQQLLSNAKEAESAERGYIITGDPSYLSSYHSAAQKVPQNIAKVRELTADNATQQLRLNALEGLIARRFAVLEDAVRSRKDSGFEAAGKVVVNGQGLAVMSQIRDLSGQIETEEYRLLQQRSRNRQARLQAGFIAVLAASVLALVALLTVPFDVRRAIRQRNLAAQGRQASEATSHALFEASSQAILIVDAAGRIVTANPATQTMFGYTSDEIAGQSVDLLVPPRLRSGHAGHRMRFFANPQSRPMGLGLDLQACRKDGTEFPTEISLNYMQSAHGTLAVAFVSDISKRKADEQAIRLQAEDLRALAAQLMTAQDDERRRIARDLHDDLSQKLAFLAMDLGKLATRPALHDAITDLRPLQLRAAEAAESVRRISHQLHPSILDDIGLEGAIEQFCDEFEQRSGISTQFTSQNVPDPLPRDVARSVYHIAQECLRNVSKHARAETVAVSLTFSDNTLRLDVADHGVGLKPAPSETGRGLGIVAMKERARLINGKLSIQSEQGMGTLVTFEVSLPSSSASAVAFE